MVVRRDVWHGSAWVGLPVIVVSDEPDLLAVYLAEGAEIAVADGEWPVVHPWSRHQAWSGHGTLMLHRPGDAYAVWVFWEGRDREFSAWYLNLQAPFARTPCGFDTLDHELDLWSPDRRVWHWKDAELLDRHIAEGRFTEDEVASIRAEGERLYRDVNGGGGWWDDAWAHWTPPDDWLPPRLPSGWDD